MNDDPDDRAATLPDDHEARRHAIDPERSFIVRAPAGSGKTTLLIRRYLVLLTRVARPEEILCMTFTRKAAGEMHSRVLAALQRAEKGEQGGDATMYELARAAIDHAHQHNWNLLQNPSRLQFHTIDGVCSRLVRQIPKGSGFGALPDVAEFPSMLYRKAAAETIACMDAGDDPVAQAVRTVLGYLDNNYERLQQLIVTMLGTRDQWLGLTGLRGDAAYRRALEQHWDEVVIHDLKRLREAMSANAEHAEEIVACAVMAARNLQEMESDSLIADCRDLNALPDAAIEALPAWRGIASLLLTQAGTMRTRVTKRDGFPSGGEEEKAGKKRMVALLEALSCGDSRAGEAVSWAPDLHSARGLPHAHYDDQQWRVLGALLMVLKQTVARLNLLIGAFGRCDYVALSTSARVALGDVDNPTDLALALDYKIQHILVDEFQDTSRSQMELLELLTAGWDGSDNRTLFLVGDPMQSIYAFRRADVGIYLRARDRGIGQLTLEGLTLTANFRSQKPLVEWVNLVFARAMPNRSDELTGAVEFSESTVSHDDDADAGVRFHAAHDKSGEAFALAAAARSEWDQNRDATIAILARSRSHLTAVLRALKNAGVPYQEVGLDPLVQRSLVQDLLALTCALLHPSDRTAWLAVLRAPWCGLELRDLEVLSAGDGEPWARMRDPEALANLSCTARERVGRMVPVLELALAERGRLSPARWIENTWLQLGGAALATEEDWPDVRLYFEQLGYLCEATGLRDYEELRESLQLVRSVAGSDGGVGDTPSNPVQVITMHSAKGLEFDVVLIPGLNRTPLSDEKKLLLWNDSKADDDTGRGLLIAPLYVSDYDENGDESGDSGEMYEYLRVFLAKKQRLEDARLLYVACTRAKRRLHLFSIVKTDGAGNVKINEDGTLAAPSAGSLVSHIWESCEADFRAAPDVGRPDEDVASAAQRARLLRVPDNWQPPAPAASIPTLPGTDEGPAADIKAPTFDWASQPARLTGIIVHRMLCLIADQGLRAWNVERVLGCRTVWTAELEAQGLEPATVKRVVGDIEKALCGSLDDPKGRWILDDNHRDARNEYDISGIVNGRLVRGVLDRIMTDADGVRWIIDYKAGVHRGADLDVFLDNERERYRPQLERYATMVSCMTNDPIRLGLYFPLVQGWREWEWRGEGQRS